MTAVSMPLAYQRLLKAENTFIIRHEIDFEVAEPQAANDRSSGDSTNPF